MLKKILFYIALLFTSVNIFAQTITYLGGTTVDGYGTGSTSISNTNFTIPAGTNRIVIVTFNIERQHSSGGNNHITTSYTTSNIQNKFFGLKIGNKNAIPYMYYDSYSSSSAYGSPTLSNATLTNYYQIYYLTDKDGLPSGSTTFDWSTIKAPANAGDEIIVNIAVYGNVGQISPFMSSWNMAPANNSSTAGTTVTSISSANAALPASLPAGRTFAERMFFANGFSSQEASNMTASAGWTQVSSRVRSNSSGSSNNLSSNLTTSEPGGISSRFDQITGQTSNPTYTITRTNATRIASFNNLVLLLEPLGKPGISGTVMIDNDGPSTISGTGTNQAASYVNLIGSDNRVVATTTVNSNGTYNFPTGILLEGLSYTVQLTKNPGSVGALAPATELNQNWRYIGESAGTSVGNDGLANGVIAFVAGSSNLTNYNFGVNSFNDNDGDGIPDDIDLDDDNDGITDCEERGITGEIDNYFEIRNDAAKTGANTIALTPATNDKKGQAWSKRKLDFSRSFTLNFEANLGSNSGGADGIAIVFHNDPNGTLAQGATGDGIGARGIQNGIVLELDSYSNDLTPAFDPTGSNGHGHIWKSSDQSDITTTKPNLGNLKDGNWRNIEVKWDAAAKKLSYRVKNPNNATYADVLAGEFVFSDIAANYFGGSNQVFFGFTASTGGYNNLQQVRFSNPCNDLPFFIDTDGDGIPDDLDTDSDGDGCPDALEGDENVLPSHLNPDGSINYLATGGLTNGVPNLVNLNGNADIGGDVGQGIGSSKNASVTTCDTRISITKTNNQVRYKRPSNAVYTITVKNEGSGIVNNVNFSDPLPTGFTANDVTYEAVAINGASVRKLASDSPASTVNGTGAISNVLNLPPNGTVTYTYRLTIKESTRGNITNTATITLPAGLTNQLPNSASDTDSPAIDAINDVFNNTAINSTKGGIVGNILTNDLLNDSTISPTSVNISLLNDGGIGATVDANGNLSVPNGTIPGIYTLTYTICEKADPTNCDTATIIFEVYDDYDKDGISDVEDLDMDNDGILNTSEMYCDMTVSPYGTNVWPVKQASATGNVALTKQLLFFNLDGVTLNNSNNTASKTIVYNGVEYTAVISEFVSSNNLISFGGYDIATYGPRNFGDRYNVNGQSYKEVLYRTDTNTVNENVNVSYKVHISAKKGNLRIPIEVVVFDGESTATSEGITFNTLNTPFKLIESTGTTAMSSIYAEGQGTRTVTIKDTESANAPVGMYSTFGHDVIVNTNIILRNNSKQGAGFAIRVLCDTDNDGLPNVIDTDSDNDGCADALEGSESVQRNHIYPLDLPSTDANYDLRGQIKVTYDGSTVQTPQNIISTSASAFGVPQLVNNAGNNLHPVTNTGNLRGIVDNTDGTADVGQTNVSAYNNAIQSNSCKVCFKPANTTGTAIPTNVGVSTIGKANDWPQNRNGAFIAIESKTKGLVLTRMSTTQINNISQPEIGMIAYDTDVNCLKVYTKNTQGVSGWYCMENQTCDE